MIKSIAMFIFGATFGALLSLVLATKKTNESVQQEIKLTTPHLIESPAHQTTVEKQASEIASMSQNELMIHLTKLEKQLEDQSLAHQKEIEEITEAASTTIANRIKEIEADVQRQLTAIMEQKQPSKENNILAEQHQTQSRDDHWASQIEMQIKDFFATHDYVNDITLTEVDCRATLCKVHYQINAEFKQQHLFNHQLRMATWYQKFGNMQSINSQGKVTLFAAIRDS